MEDRYVTFAPLEDRQRFFAAVHEDGAGRPVSAPENGRIDSSAAETVEKVAEPLFREGYGLLQRTHCSPEAHNSHVCGPRSIFSDVHAAGENDKK